jgi:ribonucleoside-diphosphate reductase alpha chain
VTDWAWQLWCDAHPRQPAPAFFVTATNMHPQAHLNMLAALQPWVDNAISKTVNVAQSCTFDACSGLFREA